MKLENLNVVCFESRHAETLANLVRLQGGKPVVAPSMKEVPLENNAAAIAFGEKLMKGEIDVLIFLTGVGARALLTVLETRHPREAVLEAFRKTVIVPRGPKPIRALKEWNVPFAVTVPEPNTWRELVDTLDRHAAQIPLKGRSVAIQEYGITNEELVAALGERGARILRVPVYRWELPDDLGPLQAAIEAIAARKMDVAVFTTAVQIDHVLKVAASMGLEFELRRAFEKMAVASVGPDCTEGLRQNGVSVDIEPESPKMGPLIVAAAEEAAVVLASKRSGGDCAAEVRAGVLGVMAEADRRECAFLKACRLEETPFTPVWLMRQAGRYMKDYRAVREKTPFLELCRNEDLACEVTVRAQQKIKADAAIIFSDILLLLEPMGARLEYLQGDGPVIHNPVIGKKEVEALRKVEVSSLAYVYGSIRKTRRALGADIPLLGFAGAPFTLASYFIEGGSSKDFSKTRQFMAADEGLWRTLLTLIADAAAMHLNAQIDAGADAVQLFDSWAGVLSPAEYERYVLPYSRRTVEQVRKSAPLIHFGAKTGPFIELLRQAGGDVIGVDHRIGLDEAWGRIGRDRAVQGNLDPEVLLGPQAGIRKHVERILKEAAGRPGHIFNLGHGVLPQTPEENVIALIEMVHELGKK